jgi:hypothetical protein
MQNALKLTEKEGCSSALPFPSGEPIFTLAAGIFTVPGPHDGGGGGGAADDALGAALLAGVADGAWQQPIASRGVPAGHCRTQSANATRESAKS